MKKLMIALGAAVMAAGLQAAVVLNWSNNDTVNYADDGGPVSGKMYLINADALYGEAGSQVSLTAQVFLDAWSSGAASFDTLVDSYSINNATVSGSLSDFSAPAIGKIVDDYIVEMTEPEGYVGGTYRNFYQVMMDGENLYISDTAANVMVKGTGGFGVEFNNTGSANALITDGKYASAGGWYSAVPEPTSGLLLLLGVAGLALRRRRA